MVEGLPREGLGAGQVLADLRALREHDLPTHGGRVFAYVYDAGVPGLDEVAMSAYAGSAHVNGLDPTAFPSLLEMENALVGAAVRLLGGGPGTSAPDAVGSVTSGGTESLMLAVKAARDARPEVVAPRLVMPVTAHAALAKAARYLGLTLDLVPVSARTLRPDPDQVAAAIRPETVLVACSAPSYAQGLLDPVAGIAAHARRAGVRCHVDACFGGWSLPYLRRLGVPVPAFDFSLPGVTSISVDLHKYAYAPKGASVLLHRDPDLRRAQYFAYADWPGYTMINSVISSTRSGGPIAAALATLRYVGDEGYLALARRTWEAVRGLADAVGVVEGVRLLCQPESTVVSFVADDPEVDLWVLVDELAVRGWHVQAQFAYQDIPPNIHLTVTAAVAPGVSRFASVLADAVAAARAHGPVRPPAELLRLVNTLTPETLTAELVAGVAAGLGLAAGGGGLPERTAMINTLLGAATPALRERLVTEFVSLLQRPVWS